MKCKAIIKLLPMRKVTVMKIEAQVVLSRCKSHQLYGIRMEKRNNDWVMTWAFGIDEKKAVAEGYTQVKMSGNFLAGQAFNGCPFCGNKRFTVCSQCGRLSCYDSKDSSVECAWCGNTGVISFDNNITLTGGSM